MEFHESQPREAVSADESGQEAITGVQGLHQRECELLGFYR
jgi:hypothetical protein